MKRNISLIFALIVLPLLGCSSGPPPLPPPDAQTMADFLAFYSSGYQQEADLFFGFADCASAHAAIDPVVGQATPVDCDNGGQYNVTITQFNCNDGPPLTMSTLVKITYSSCMVNGLTLNGNSSGDEDRDDNSFILSDAANNLQVDDTVQGENFSFDIDILFEATQGIPGACSGTITVNGQTCDVSADCATCVF